MERRNFQEISPSSASHSRKFEQDSERRNFLKNCGLVRIQGKEHSSAYHAPVIDMGESMLPLILTLLRSLRLPSTAMSPVPILIHQSKFLSEHESSNGAGEISRNFLQVLRATRESSRKILRKENSSKKSALVRNLRKERSSKQHPPVIFLQL